MSELPAILNGYENDVDGLCETGRIFWQRGWSVGTSSNYSVISSRDPLELIVTASGKDKGRLTRADFVRIRADGTPVADGQPKSSAETLLHVETAQQPEVGAVLHTHSVWGTLLSDIYFEQGGFEIAGYEMLKGLAGITTHDHSIWVTIFDNTQDIASLAKLVRAQWDDDKHPLRHGFLIRKHGLYTWGKDLNEARRHIEIFEFRQMIKCL